MSSSDYKVLGYIKPTSAFRSIGEWENLALKLIELQSQGFDTRGGEINCSNAQYCDLKDFENFVLLIAEYFGYLLTTEVNRYELLTRKNVLDFIEDFVNHRVWGLENEFGNYFPDIRSLRFAYFYSRGDIEPYVLLDEAYTSQMYGSVWNPKELNHYASPNGLANLETALAGGKEFDISCFTVADRPFFRSGSNLLVKLTGNVRAGFRSDIKSLSTDSGRRACNLYRLEYPGKDLNNICYELDSCDGEVRTSLWNEYIATPLEILEVKEI